MDIIIKYIEWEKGAQNAMVHIEGKKKSPRVLHRVNSTKIVKDAITKLAPTLCYFFCTEDIWSFLYYLYIWNKFDSKNYVKTYHVKLQLVYL